MSFKTEQEDFWAGAFGTEYIGRNAGDALVASNIAFFAKSLGNAGPISTCLEFGANIGMNLKALRLLFPTLDASAIEINADAVEVLARTIPPSNIHHGSILEFEPKAVYDLVLIKGVLIHIHPEALPSVYDSLYRSASRYLLVAEYYNPSPMSLPYRGHSDRLFKRDFAGELLDKYDDLVLRDYGFVYRRDPKYPQDDITWFLLEKVR